MLAPAALTSDNTSENPILNSLTNGKVIIIWGNYEIYDSVLHYAVINSGGGIAKPEARVEFGYWNFAIVWPQSYDAVLLPNGKVALAWVNGAGVEFGILNASYDLESGPHIGNDDTPGGGISVTTDASSHVIMTWVADQYSKLFYALGNSSGAFLTDPMVYHTNGEYINVNWHGQGSVPLETLSTTGGPDTTGVFRPSNGALYLKNTNATGFADVQINYGLPGDYPVVGDWDGDGDATIGIYRNGTFYLRNSNTIGFADIVFPFGAPGDQPVAGDWNNDGIDTIGVYRNGTFYLRNSNSAGTPSAIFSLGVAGDVGIAGDWNGDGIDTTGVFRPSNGALYLKNTNATGFADIQINYGLPGDRPVTGDWNDDGIDTIGIYRNGTFYLRNSNTIGFADLVFALGIPGDHPIAGNWDGLP